MCLDYNDHKQLIQVHIQNEAISASFCLNGHEKALCVSFLSPAICKQLDRLSYSVLLRQALEEKKKSLMGVVRENASHLCAVLQLSTYL